MPHSKGKFGVASQSALVVIALELFVAVALGQDSGLTLVANLRAVVSDPSGARIPRIQSRQNRLIQSRGVFPGGRVGTKGSALHTRGAVVFTEIVMDELLELEISTEPGQFYSALRSTGEALYKLFESELREQFARMHAQCACQLEDV